MTTRHQAIQWWNNECTEIREMYSQQYFKRHFLSLTGREIEEIYKLEHLKKGIKVQYKDKVLTVLNDVGFIGQRGKMIPCVDDKNNIDDYCIDDLILFSGEKTKTENIYLNRLKEQYKQLRKYKANETTSDNYWKQKDYYDAMRLFCLDTQLLDFNTIEVMEDEVNSVF